MFEDIIGKREELLVHGGGQKWENGEVIEEHKFFIVIDTILYPDRPGWTEISRKEIKQDDPLYKKYEEAWIKKWGEKP